MAATGTTTTPFVGRDDELAVLADALRADGASPTLIRISGEAGVGKSRLVAEAVRRSGRRALTGYSSPGSLGRPFDLLLSAIEPTIRGWSEIPPALSGVRIAVTELLRGTAPGLDGDRPPDGVSPADLIGAGIALVRHLEPAVLVLEDLHWADLESLQVVERVLAAPDHPVVIATYRSEDLDEHEPAAELLGTMGRTSRHLRLQPFGSDEIESLLTRQVGHPPTAGVVDRLRARTGGNAFYLEELLASADVWEHGADHPDPFPETLTDTVRLRLDGLRPDERDTLATAAVLGSPFEFDLLATALDVDEAELIERLRTLIDRRLLVEPEIDVFRFRHELVRESMLSSLLGRERRRLHDRAWAATVEHRPDAFAELAHHAAASGRRDDLARLAPDGIRHYLARGSTRQALALAELTLTEWPDDEVVLELAARAAWLTGRSDAAERHALRWRRLTDRRPDGCAVEPLALLARLAYEHDDDANEAAVVTEMEELLDSDLAPADRARLLTELAQHHMLMDHVDRSVQCAEEARALAEEHGLDGLILQIGVEQASAEAGTVDRPRAIATLERLADEAQEAGEYVTAARALHNLSLFQPPDQADRTLDAMAEVAELGGFDLATVVLLPVRKADMAVTRADLHAAQEWIDRAPSFVRRLRSGKHLRFLELMVNLETGAVGTPDLDGFPSDAAWIWSLRLRYAARRGDHAEVSRALAEPPLADPQALLSLGAALADLAAAGIDTAAVGAAGQAIQDSGVDQVGADIGGALLAERTGHEDAADRFDALPDLSVEVPPPMKVAPLSAVSFAEVALARARLAARAGRSDERRRHAEDAANRLARWPGPRRDEALALAAEDTAGNEDLTGREIDVTRLVARGMTNGQIADELFIARKTVSTHVSNILTKLGMSSRTEIAAWAVRSGLAPSEV